MTTPVFLIPMVIGLLTQFSKRFFNKFSTVQVGNLSLPRYGGMPSAHAAFGFSVATVVFLTEGINSAAFAISTALVVLLLDDALRMRVYLGQHGKALIYLAHRLPKDQQKDLPSLQDKLGHTPQEVAVGAIFGIVLTVLFMMMFLPPDSVL